ncbi:hypothetical protein AB2L27_08095 [Kineococcus sp. LSe6-4]|uniref:Uncharacterized protein n=1 Tax=Kineococcus halophytocola TaxID=3234027 RepID=A0ABV4H070_9ACTN
MSTERAQQASTAEQERVGFKTCVGVVIMFLTVVLFVTASTTRDVVTGCILFLVGAQLVLPGGKQGRALRVASAVLAVAAVALVVVDIAVL